MSQYGIWAEGDSICLKEKKRISDKTDKNSQLTNN